MLPNNCYNCNKCCKEVYDNDVNDKKNLLINSLCSFHNVEVSEKYTCDSFEEK